MIDGGIATRKLLAHFFGKSEPTVSKYVDQGMPCIDRGKKGTPAQFDVRECFAWYVEYVVRAGEAKPQRLTEREQLVDIETKELKLRQLKNDLVERAAAVHVIRGLHLQTANQLRQGPRRFAHRLINLPDMAAAVEVQTAIAEEQIADLRIPDTWAALHEQGSSVTEGAA